MSDVRRECGECKECCFAFNVREIGKPEFENCPHECENGCSTYPSRPQSCRDFDCAWLSGFFTIAGVGANELRPDLTGLVPVFQDGLSWVLFETRKNARYSAVGSKILRHLNLYRDILICHGDETTRIKRGDIKQNDRSMRIDQDV